MKHCVHCGEEMADDANVCPNCGTDQDPTFGDDEEDRTENPDDVRNETRDEGRDGPGGTAQAGDRGGETKFCVKCGAEIDVQAELCPECGVRQPASGGNSTSDEQVIAGILAIMVGGFGVHKFYQGNIAWGVLYLCFFWTGIPVVLGLIEGILMLVADEDEYYEKYADGSVLGA